MGRILESVQKSAAFFRREIESTEAVRSEVDGYDAGDFVSEWLDGDCVVCQ